MKKIVTLLFVFTAFLPSAFGQQYFSDDFESYLVNDFLGVASPTWTTWSNSPGSSEDVKIVDTDAFSGTKSIYINSPFGGGPNDVVLPFGGVHNTGRFKFSSKFKIPTGKAAYFNFQGGASTGTLWTIEFSFRTGGTFDIASSGGLTGTYPQGSWFDLTIDIDYTTGTWEVFIDNVSKGKFTNTNPVSYLDIFPADANSEFWVDDVSFCRNNACNAEIQVNSVSVNPNPVCTHHPADVTVNLKNNSTFQCPGLELEIEVGGSKNKQYVPLKLDGGKDTTVTITGLFNSKVAGSNLPVSAVNASGDLVPSNDTAKTTMNVNASPSGSFIGKSIPFTTPRPLTQGTDVDPDIVAAKDALTYEIGTPVGYTSGGFGTTWDIVSLTVKTKNGTTVSPTLYTYTQPSSGGNGKISFNPDSTLTDSAIVVSFVVINKSTLCDSALTRHIFVAPRPKVDFSAVNVCDKEDVVFTNNTTISSGLLSYEWKFGDGSSANLTQPIKLYDMAGSYNVKLIVTSDYGYKDSITKVVDVYQIPTANFEFVNACEGTALTFSDKSALPSGTPTFDWDFGTSPVSTGTGATTSKLYNVPNTYNVTLRVTVNGCSSSISKLVTQAPRTTPDFSFTATQCDNKDVDFTNNTAQPSFGSASFFWRLGDGGLSTQVSPKHTYNTFNSFDVTLISTTNFGCADSVVKTVALRQSPTASFTNTTVDCSRSPIAFTNTSVVPAGSTNNYEWDFGDGSADNTANPTYQYANPGVYNITMKAKSSNGCSSETQSTLVIKLKPKADFAAINVCAGTPLNITNTSVSPDNSPLTYKWYFGNGDSSTVLSPTVNYATNGVYNVTLYTENPTGCVDTKTQAVTVYETPVVSILSSSASTGNGGFKFTTNTTGTGYTYFWLFGDGGSSTQQSPEYVYNDDGLKFVHLVVTTPDGCKGQMADTVSVFRLGVNGASQATVSVYPNPSAGKFMVNFSDVNMNDVTDMYVTDLLGRTVINNIAIPVSGVAEFDLAGQAAGIYYLNINTVNGLQTVKLSLK